MKTALLWTAFVLWLLGCAVLGWWLGADTASINPDRFAFPIVDQTK